MTQNQTLSRMRVEVTPDAPSAVSQWLDEVAGSLGRVHDVLMEPSLERLEECQAQLPAAVQRLEEFCELAGKFAVLDPGAAQRLRLMRQQVIRLEALVRQASAFYRGLEQVDARALIGYTPHGLEHAL